MIDIWGADHHGYVPRMKAAFTALPPHDPDRLELIIGQLVNLLESGEAKRMSKRKGDIVTVDDLLDAIGVDAARFFLVSRRHDSTLELDIDLALEQSQQEPGLLRAVRARAHLQHPAESARTAAGAAGRRSPAGRRRRRPRELAGAGAGALPAVLLAAADQRAPHRLHAYLGELAAEFHVFYRHCRVLVDDPDMTALSGRPVRGHARRWPADSGCSGSSAPEPCRRGRAAHAAARSRQAPQLSLGTLRSSSACSGVSSRSSPSSCDTATLGWFAAAAGRRCRGRSARPRGRGSPACTRRRCWSCPATSRFFLTRLFMTVITVV